MVPQRRDLPALLLNAVREFVEAPLELIEEVAREVRERAAVARRLPDGAPIAREGALQEEANLRGVAPVEGLDGGFGAIEFFD